MRPTYPLWNDEVTTQLTQTRGIALIAISSGVYHGQTQSLVVALSPEKARRLIDELTMRLHELDEKNGDHS